MKTWPVAVSFLCLFLATVPVSAHSPQEIHKELVENLAAALQKPEAEIEAILSDPRIKKYPKFPSPKRFTSEEQEAARNRWNEYVKELLGAESVKRGVDYLLRHSEAFAKAEKRYGVQPFIIAAILRIESNFGQNTGKYLVLDSLYSRYVLRPGKRAETLVYLSCFWRIAEKHGWDLFSVKGSSAGAIGMMQFMPCQLGEFAVDADGRKTIDVFTNHENTISSTANFLKRRGKWSFKFLDQDQALLRYNFDRQYYVNPLLEYYDLLVRAFYRRVTTDPVRNS